MNKKIVTAIILSILIIPVFLFFFKPEINLDSKYIKFSWARSTGEVKQALKEKKPEEVIKKIYDRSGVVSNTRTFSEKIKSKIHTYINYSKNKIQVFIRKWKNFISSVNFI